MDEDAFGAYRRASRIVAVALAIGLASIVVFGLQAQSPPAFASVVSVGAIAAGAAFAVGGIVGFIFGVPRSLQEQPSSIEVDERELTAGTGTTAAPAARLGFAGNTSLEQISDWLTKILVGVGLTQLANMPAGLAAVGDFLGPGLGGFEGSSTFGSVAVVYFGIGGFFVTYLWTRLYFRTLLEEEARKARDAAQRKWALNRTEIEEDREDADVAASQPQVLWVDDRPFNNRREIQLLEARGIAVTTRTSTEAALETLSADPNRFKLVISDMGRGLDRKAGYRLLEAMRDRGLNTPFVIYAGSGDPEHDLEAKRRGGLGSTNDPGRLFELVEMALKEKPN